MKNIFYGKQYISQSDTLEVINSLKQDLITTGNYVEKYENKIKKKFKSNYVLSCSSGTAGIDLALRAIDLKKGDNVIIPAINFVAAANVCKRIGANIFFSDINLDTGQMSPNNLIDCIKKYKLKTVKVIFTMFLSGAANYTLEFYKLKKKFNFYILEDACHALGAKYISKKNILPVGSAKHCDISIFSTHPVKSITTGEGGFVSTNKFLLYKKMKLLRSHGIERHNLPIDYNILLNGFNYRLSDINCALGFSQIKKIDQFVNKRKLIFLQYIKNFRDWNSHISFLNSNNSNLSACHLVVALINFKKLTINKKIFFYLLKYKKINCQFHYIPTYKFKIFNKKEKLHNSEVYFKNAISLPIYYEISFKQVNFICNEIKKIIKKYSKVK
jgi:dTDP-4-amino-4,6-dideoxygalactose transaminase